MGNLFFSPKGRIGSGTFLKAGVVMAIVSGLLYGLNSFIPSIGLWAGVLFLLTMYPWFCLWSKRLHNGGKGTGLAFAYIPLFFILMLIFMAVSVLIFSGADFTDAMTEFAKKEISQEEYMERINSITSNIDTSTVARNNILSVIVASLVTLFIGDRATPNSGEENQYGPA